MIGVQIPDRFALSAMLCKTLPVLSITLTLTLLPNLLVNAGLPLEIVDFQSYFAVTPIWSADGILQWIIVAVGAILITIQYLFAKQNNCSKRT